MGGGAQDAQRAAKRAEDERQRTIAAGTQRVNQIFDSPERQAQYQDFLSALRENYTTDLNRQKNVADRRSRFALARSGLTGGSAEVDTKRTMGEDYTQALLRGESRVQDQAGTLRTQDENARAQILDQLQRGLDMTTAASRANSLLSANAQSARGGALAEGLGDAFGNTADLYKRREEDAARRRGMVDAQVSLYGNSAFGR